MCFLKPFNSYLKYFPKFQNIRINWFKWKTPCIIFQPPTNLDGSKKNLIKITKEILDCSKRELLSENTWSNPLSNPIFFSFSFFFYFNMSRSKLNKLEFNRIPSSKQGRFERNKTRVDRTVLPCLTSIRVYHRGPRDRDTMAFKRIHTFIFIETIFGKWLTSFITESEIFYSFMIS